MVQTVFIGIEIRGVTGSAVSSLGGVRVKTRPPKGFIALCAARLPLSPCVDLLVYSRPIVVAMRVTGGGGQIHGLPQ